MDDGTGKAGPLRNVGDAWRRMGNGKRIAAAVIGSVVAINLGLAGLGTVTGGGDPGGPTSSAFSTGNDGFAAWADLLAQRGHEVTRLRTALDEARLPSTSTLVLADPQQLTAADVRHVAAFLGAGGRLVLAGAAATPVLAAVTGEQVRWAADGVSHARALIPVGEAAGIRTVDASGRGRYLDVGGLLPVLGAGGRVVAVAGPSGRGWVVGLADPGVVQNDRLAKADNASWALALVRPGSVPVVFAESVHGFGEATGLGALPASWRWAALGLGGAALAMMWTFGQRFGPVESEHRRLRPPRRDYVDAMAADLARIRPPPAEVAAPLIADARDRLSNWLGLPPDADDASVRADAARAGVDPADVEPILTPPATDEQVLAMGRAAAHIRQITDRTPVLRGGH